MATGMCSSPVRGTLLLLSKLEQPSSLAHGSMGEGTGARAFRWWIRNLEHRVLYSIHAVAQLSRTAEDARKYDARQSTRKWLSWLHEGPAAGLGRQHQMPRVAGGWIPSRTATVKVGDGALSADPEHSWQQDLEDLSEEFVVQQANSACGGSS